MHFAFWDIKDLQNGCQTKHNALGVLLILLLHSDVRLSGQVNGVHVRVQHLCDFILLCVIIQHVLDLFHL